jgi:lipoate-protein ligase A
LPGSDILPYKNNPWRFINDGESSGAFNMARDEALARSAHPGSAPTLRVYKFKPAAISVGRFQRLSGHIDLKACERNNIDVVRRPTGGLAILHLDDFTYSVSLPRQTGEIDSRDWYFEFVAGGILETLLQLGIEGSLVSHSKGNVQNSPWCIDRAFGVDVEWGGKKICGSAQRLYKHAVLHHGSFFLDVNAGLMQQITPEYHGDNKAQKLTDSFISLPEASGEDITWEQFNLALQEGFSRFLNVELSPGRWSEDEELLAKRLNESKYNKDYRLSG